MCAVKYVFYLCEAYTFISVILLWVFGRVDEISTYNWSRFCTVNQWQNCRYQTTYSLTLESGMDSNSNLKSKRQVCYHCATVVSVNLLSNVVCRCAIGLIYYSLPERLCNLVMIS